MEEFLTLQYSISVNILTALDSFYIFTTKMGNGKDLYVFEETFIILFWASAQDILTHILDTLNQHDGFIDYGGSSSGDDNNKKKIIEESQNKKTSEKEEIAETENNQEEKESEGTESENNSEEEQKSTESQEEITSVTVSPDLGEDMLLFYNYLVTHVKEGDIDSIKQDVSVLMQDCPEEFKESYTRMLLTAAIGTLGGVSLGLTIYLLLDLYCDMSIGVSFWDFGRTPQPKPPLNPVEILIQLGLNPTEILVKKRNPIFSDVYNGVDYVTQDQPLIIFPNEMPNNILLNCGVEHDILEGIDYNPRTGLSDVYIDPDNQNNFHMFDPTGEEKFTALDESIPIHGDISNQPGLYSNCGYVPYDPTLRYDEILAHNDFEITVPDFEKK